MEASQIGGYDQDVGYLWSKIWSNLNFICFTAMCGEFSEVAAIIGLVFDFLVFGTPLLTFRDTSS